jgi:hypothetical protein
MRNFINLLLALLMAISAQNLLASAALNVAGEQQNGQQTPPPDQQTPSTSQGQGSSTTAVKSYTGCVVQGDRGYSLKTESDTIPIETDRDLSQYVNKQVKVTGILEHHNAATPSSASGNAAVITDLRLRVVASVIGDCKEPSK